MAALLPLDHDRACPKCNTDGAIFRYCAGETRGGELDAATIAIMRRNGVPLELCVGVTVEEHQHRKCRLCGYEWLEHVYVPPPPTRAQRRRRPDPEEDE